MLEWIILAALAILILGPRNPKLKIAPIIVLVLALSLLYFKLLISIWEFLIILVATMIAFGLSFRK